jgi:hypothetical protein
MLALSAFTHFGSAGDFGIKGVVHNLDRSFLQVLDDLLGSLLRGNLPAAR